MLVPMVLGMTLQSNHLLRIDLPEWLLSMAYAVMGWRIGLGFTRQVLKRSFRALPQIMPIYYVTGWFLRQFGLAISSALPP